MYFLTPDRELKKTDLQGDLLFFFGIFQSRFGLP